MVSTVKNMHYNMWGVTNHSEIKRAKHFKIVLILKEWLYDYGILPSVFYSRIMWKIVQDILKLFFFLIFQSSLRVVAGFLHQFS